MQATERPVEIRLLGPLRVTRGGEEVELAAGRPRALVAYVALNGGAVAAEAAGKALWPEADRSVAG